MIWLSILTLQLRNRVDINMSQLSSAQQSQHLHQLEQEQSATENDAAGVFSTAKANIAANIENDALSLSQQQELRAILEKGLPHAAQPYLVIAQELNTTEAQILAQIHLWQEDSLIKRFGLVVKHRKLGFKANAMVVWNIADDQVEDVAAAKLSSCPEVSLCYRRPRRLPHWPYNLFCMIHGTDREHRVTAQIDAMVEQSFPCGMSKKMFYLVLKPISSRAPVTAEKGHAKWINHRDNQRQHLAELTELDKTVN